MLKKRDAKTAAGGQPLLAPGVFGEDHPCVWEFLTEARWPDGSPRVLGTITVFADEGVVKLCVNDRAQSLVAFVTASTLEGAFHALEEGMEDDRLDWRAPSGARKKR